MKRQKQFEFSLTEKIIQQRKPLRMSPSFRIKYYSPTKVQKMKFDYQKDIRQYKSHCFDQFIDNYHIPTIHTQRAASQKRTCMYSRQQTPSNSQVNHNNSEIQHNKYLEFSKLTRQKRQIKIIHLLQ
ncbi:unnamed protein product (macronuclear) [Paramecium tetraurelia]|uniref:Uncharacterized protein n=1 Tax=Paramecium tetraurelia TaxID=5888 RepID=A0DBA6_PARTE|nr:uncharacterized protein GSPATT00015217001 [Paramecium tetraurelia]CAK80323.1 unnamed protein product [Paramecium tetraurelia]|eukprot:XP_001447720.1 hypothetical protein (macronuclear) [Paramecium tetraurelia strain d4-2]